MKLYVLKYNKDTKKYERDSYIDQASSVLWDKKYNDIGECEIYIECTTELRNILKSGNYIYRYDDDMFCKIKKVKIETDIEDGDYLIVTGKDICTVLSDRIIRWNTTYSGTVFNFIKRIITENVISPAQDSRKIENFEFDNSNESEFTETIEITAFSEDLLQLIITLCKTYNYGFRISYDIKLEKLVFKLYKGKVRSSYVSDSYVEFSPTYANIISSDYEEDESNYKNLAYISYKNSKDEIGMMSVFNTEFEPSGEQRKEIFIDGTSTSRDITETELLTLFEDVRIEGDNYVASIDGEDVLVATKNEDKVTVTDYTYLKLIRILGLNKLAETVKTQTFVGEIDTINTYQYKKDYNLGDIVKVVNEYDISAEARIVEMLESDDDEDGYVIEPKFEYIS